jgi:hypothetical protein
LFVFTPGRIEVVGSWVGNVSSGIIRYDGDVIAYLVLHRPAFERRKRSAHGDVRRPCDAAIRAKRIEQLRIRVIRSITRVQPHRIDPSIGGYRQRAKPVPLIVINGIVIDSVRRTKG